MFTATLIARDGLAARDILEARDRLDAARCEPTQDHWLEQDVAADLHFAVAPEAARSALEGAFATVDVVVQPTADRVKRLLIADMDSTMITVECIDELADFAGLKPAVAAITERAMRGELDFAEALAERVGLLRDLPLATVDRCLAERVRITPGAETLVRTMRARGARTILVSGGFTRFADPVAARIGFDEAIANRLVVTGDRLAGTVEPPIVDAATKLATLEREIAAGIPRAATLSVGDGANDLPMIRHAGLGVAFRAKPVVAAAASARIEHGDLTALLYAQGIPRAEWVS